MDTEAIEIEVRRLLSAARDHEQRAEMCRKRVRELLRVLLAQSGDPRPARTAAGRIAPRLVAAAQQMTL
jgi:hypothetical protein